jgi:hypothetical protein
VADKNFDLNKFVISLRAKKIPWKDLYWKLYSCVLDFNCVTCDTRFTGNQLNLCMHHPGEAFYTYGENKG